MNLFNQLLPVFALFLLASVVLLVFALLKKKTIFRPGDFQRKKVLTQTEQAFYHFLCGALEGEDIVVFAQVSMSQMLKAVGQQRMANFRRVSQKSVDFVLCDPAFAVIAAIEVDDPTHNRADRRKADAVKNAAFASAGVPLLRWPTHDLPDERAIREAVAQCRAAQKKSVRGRVEPSATPLRQKRR